LGEPVAGAKFRNLIFTWAGRFGLLSAMTLTTSAPTLLQADLEARIDAPLGADLRLVVALGGAAPLWHARQAAAGRARDREARGALAGVAAARMALVNAAGCAVHGAQSPAARLVRARRRLQCARAAGLALVAPAYPAAT
jgi:hypothetical protein